MSNPKAFIAYANAQASIADTLESIKHRLALHAQRSTETGPINFAHVGDLMEVQALLANVQALLG